MLSKKSAGIVILTLNAEKEIEKILHKINFQKYKVIIIDSESEDNTVKICKNYDCKIHMIKKSDFNHGATREFGRKIIGTDVVIFLTQDAIPVGENTFNLLIDPIINGETSVTYAKPLASVFPSMAWGLFLIFEKVGEYNDEFIEFPIKENLETNYYLGS